MDIIGLCIFILWVIDIVSIRIRQERISIHAVCVYES